MIVRNILKLTWVLVIFFVSGCFYVPKIEENKNENCELITKKMTIENRGEFPQGCNDECLLVALGVATTSYIVSGTITVVGNTIHWIEKQGRCEDSFMRE